MMKKGMCILLALMLCAGCVGALADQEERTIDIPAMGLRFVLPQEYEDAMGLIGTDGVLELDSGLYYLYFYYLAVTQEEYDRMYAETPEELTARSQVLFYAFAVGEGKDFSEVTRLTDGALPEDGALKLGQEGEYSFYLYWIEDAGFSAALDDAFREEYSGLCTLKEQIAAAIACYPPVNEYTNLDGHVIRFEALDLDGNPVSSEELFARHAVTLVHVWATWCGPCVGELKDLQELHTRFQEKDCAVVGLLIDDDVEEARRLMEANGITYDVVRVFSTFTFSFPYSTVPTSFYVDRNGAFLGTKFTGVYPAEMYEWALEPLLPQ